MSLKRPLKPEWSLPRYSNCGSYRCNISEAKSPWPRPYNPSFTFTRLRLCPSTAYTVWPLNRRRDPLLSLHPPISQVAAWPRAHAAGQTKCILFKQSHAKLFQLMALCLNVSLSDGCGSSMSGRWAFTTSALFHHGASISTPSAREQFRGLGRT